MGNSIILTQMTELSLMIALGFFLLRIGLLNVEFNKNLTKFLLSVTTPALILSSVLHQEQRLDSTQIAYVFAVGIALYFIFPIIAFVVIKIMRFPYSEQGLYTFMLIYGNIGFMGFPVIDALYGSTAVFYTAIINIIFNLSVFTVGLWLIHFGTDKKASFSVKNILTPGVIGSSLSIVIYFANIHFPPVLTDTITAVGSLTSPLAMIMLGSTLGCIKFKDIFTDRHLYPFVIVKQFLLPIAAWYVLSFTIHDSFVLGITYVLTLMPTANISVLFATNYGADETLAAKGVFLTTLVSIFSIPLFMSIFM